MGRYGDSARNAELVRQPRGGGGNPKIADIVFLSLDYSSLGCI